MMDNMIRLIAVSASTFIVIFGSAAILWGGRKNEGSVMDKLVFQFVIGSFFVINAVYLLLFLRITSRWATILIFLLLALALRYVTDKKAFRQSVEKARLVFRSLTQGSYGWNYFFHKTKERVNREIRKSLWIPLKNNWIEALLFAIVIGIHSYYIGYRFIGYSGFGVSDEPVHLFWIQEMLQGRIFADGAYPFGMHNVIYAVAKIFEITPFTVVRYFGFVIAMVLLLMLYGLLKKMCRSRYAPMIGLILYVFANLFYDFAWDRIQFAIPQEFGLIFLYPAALYLYEYIQTRKKSDLVLLVLALSLTVHAHYYVTIVAGILCVLIVLAQIARVWKEKFLIPLIAAAFISILLGFLPIGIGLASGYGAQGSLYWAIGVITESTEETVETQQHMAFPQDEEKAEIAFADRLMDDLKTIKEKANTDLMSANVFNRSISGLILILFYTAGRKIRKKGKKETSLQLAFALYIFVLFVMLAAGALDLPVIMENYRVSVFLSYALPMVFSMLFEMIYETVEAIPSLKTGWEGFVLASVVVAFVVIAQNPQLQREHARFILMQSEGSVEVYYRILEQYEDDSWTIVSPVEEYSMVLDRGYHYEWVDFIKRLENDPGNQLYLPTKHLFFYIEKRPIPYGSAVRIDEGPGKQDPFTEEDAQGELSPQFNGQPSEYYRFEREKIMAKAYQWAKTYQSFFPREMTVFYEDEEFICFRLEQEPYYLNNLMIDVP